VSLQVWKECHTDVDSGVGLPEAELCDRPEDCVCTEKYRGGGEEGPLKSFFCGKGFVSSINVPGWRFL
jgi:hypothetical protein